MGDELDEEALPRRAGRLLIYAPREHGVRGVAMNINRDQVESATRRIAAAGLSDRIEVRCGSYNHPLGRV